MRMVWTTWFPQRSSHFCVESLVFYCNGRRPAARKSWTESQQPDSEVNSLRIYDFISSGILYTWFMAVHIGTHLYVQVCTLVSTYQYVLMVNLSMHQQTQVLLFPIISGEIIEINRLIECQLLHLFSIIFTIIKQLFFLLFKFFLLFQHGLLFFLLFFLLFVYYITYFNIISYYFRVKPPKWLGLPGAHPRLMLGEMTDK